MYHHPVAPTYTDRQGIEIFHLLFLRAIANGPQKSYLIVKGGCNLRFFFGSVRYSEDLDLDVSVIARETLRKNVDKALESTALIRPLASYGLTLEGISAPKQTDTTQRWKATLRPSGHAVPLNTKIEFSRRGAAEGVRLDAVNSGLAHGYRMTPPLVCHYLPDVAIAQKIGALAGRAEAQARDVFDLALLLPHVEGKLTVGSDVKRLAPHAIERALGISYDEYVAQVVAYLAPDEGEAFASREAWEAQQLQVTEALEGLSK